MVNEGVQEGLGDLGVVTVRCSLTSEESLQRSSHERTLLMKSKDWRTGSHGLY